MRATQDLSTIVREPARVPFPNCRSGVIGLAIAGNPENDGHLSPWQEAVGHEIIPDTHKNGCANEATTDLTLGGRLYRREELNGPYKRDRALSRPPLSDACALRRFMRLQTPFFCTHRPDSNCREPGIAKICRVKRFPALRPSMALARLHVTSCRVVAQTRRFLRFLDLQPVVFEDPGCDENLRAHSPPAA